MSSWYGKCICALVGCNWVEQAKIAVTTGPRGTGTIIWEECSRCEDTRCKWVADISFGRHTKEIIPLSVKITPSLCNEIDPHVEEAAPAAQPTKVRAKKAATATAEAA